MALTYEGTGADGYGYSNLSGDLVIPPSVTYDGTTYSVTTIGDNAFCGCTGLTEITIPNSLTTIGGWAFEGCSGLTQVTINSNAIVSSGRMTGIFGSQVQEYIIGDDVTTISSWAFNLEKTETECGGDWTG